MEGSNIRFYEDPRRNSGPNLNPTLNESITPQCCGMPHLFTAVYALVYALCHKANILVRLAKCFLGRFLVGRAPIDPQILDCSFSLTSYDGFCTAKTGWDPVYVLVSNSIESHDEVLRD